MTKTIQPCSSGLYERSENFIKTKPEAEDNKSLILSVFDSLNNLREKINRLNYLIERRKMERILYQKP
jgi:hypothetical protein